MASLTEEVYKEERLTGPVEFYVDAYKRPSSLFDTNTKKNNQKSYKKYLDDYIRIYKKKRGDASVAEITKNFDKKIKLERQRRRDETEEVRAVQKDERTSERTLQNRMKDVLEKKTYGPIGQLKDSAKASKEPPSSMHLKMFKRKQAAKLDDRYKKKMEELKKVGPLPLQLVGKTGPSPLSSGASKTTAAGGGRKTRKKRGGIISSREWVVENTQASINRFTNSNLPERGIGFNNMIQQMTNGEMDGGFWIIEWSLTRDRDDDYNHFHLAWTDDDTEPEDLIRFVDGPDAPAGRRKRRKRKTKRRKRKKKKTKRKRKRKKRKKKTRRRR